MNIKYVFNYLQFNTFYNFRMKTSKYNLVSNVSLFFNFIVAYVKCSKMY